MKGKSKSKSKSSILFVISVVAIILLAFVGFKGIKIAGWEVKSFNNAITKGLDLQGGVSVLMEIQEDDVSSDVRQRTKQLLELRVNKIGVAETVVTEEGEKRIRIDIPGAYDSNEIVDGLSKTGNLEFKDADGNVVLTGKDVKDATAILDDTSRPVVSLELNADGQEKFAEVTANNIGKTISIYMDDEVVSSPVVQNTITNGKAVINGMSSMDEATKLAGVISSGALPVSIKAVSINNVGAQLGSEALPNAVKAGVIGIGIIFLFAIIYYRIPGIFASIALTLYITLVLLVFTELKVALTLPGIAALLLTIGMAVDANILIFERIKEELKNGISVKSAVKAGFENAMSSIVDSNSTTFIAALILYFIGSGSVKGFAVTLMIGIVLSLFTALIVTKTLMNLSIDMGLLKKKWQFGNKKERKPFNIVQKTKIWFVLSSILILIGLGFTVSRGLNFGIDFQGGTKMVVNLGEGFNKVEADEIVKALVPDAVTNEAADTQYEIKAKELDSSKVSEVFKALQDKYNLEDDDLLSQDEIGASVGKELTRNSIIALVIACLAMLVYIAIRFKMDYGIAAIIALVHDLLITVSVFAIFNIPVNTPFIAAILTIVGYSINDTIVIFDRIRENSKNMRRASSTEIANKSLTQTMSRSINTTLTTLITITAVNIFVPTVREFSFPLIIGIAAGAYSSIFIAAPTWVLLRNREDKKSV
ncbi:MULTISPECIES: protein translocase subunit SecD [unclassified Clostridium]|jgi:protein-export membrane protein, secD/secF family|uniref:protein translocase subunit SecD n=1 Tax=unclassified Clostridium TaxID=2614128 RepID=UPI0025C1AC72|nr:protein translocase subunit SecD [Clostridium sp.]MDY2631094.1 protein translocase subunit SecD [Clostridium sp.]MDY4251820.1 protein translocase subunit SecD [Clostridium sp.]